MVDSFSFKMHSIKKYIINLIIIFGKRKNINVCANGIS